MLMRCWLPPESVETGSWRRSASPVWSSIRPTVASMFSTPSMWQKSRRFSSTVRRR
jgi:hypothetical protein